jgi:glutathione S-transferase
MQLIGVNRSPYTRRVAITLAAYGVPYEQHCVSGFGNRDEVRQHNPLGRIPALVLDDGETLLDSGAIVDFLDERYGGEHPTVPRAGAERRGVLRVAAMMVAPATRACRRPIIATTRRSRSAISRGSTIAWRRCAARSRRSMRWSIRRCPTCCSAA